MDGFSHSMAGVLIGTLATTKKDKLYPMALTGALASFMPDFDFPLLIKGMDFFYEYHRLYTHNFVALPFLALLASIPAWRWVKQRYIYTHLIAVICVLVHLAMDLPFAWYLRLLYPFSDKNFAMDLFNGKDTDFTGMMVITVVALGTLYWYQRPQKEEAQDDLQNDNNHS